MTDITIIKTATPREIPIKENMDIHVPDEVFNIRKWDC